MEPIGPALGVLGQARTLLSSLKERIEVYKEGPSIFAAVCKDLCRSEETADAIKEIYLKNRAILPKETASLSYHQLLHVRNRLEKSAKKTVEYCAKAFDSTAERTVEKISQKAWRLFRAKTMARIMSSIEKDTSCAANMLKHLQTELVVALTAEQAKSTVVHESHKTRATVNHRADNIETLVICQGEKTRKEIALLSLPQEKFRVASNAPMLPENMQVNFSSDPQGVYTHEGELRNKVLSERSPPVVHAAVGMAGVGKSTALIALAHDPAIARRFPGGILFMSFGADATAADAVLELANSMRAAGAGSSADAVEKLELKDAARRAATWFQGKSCLFLMDDLWPSELYPRTFLVHLRNILQGDPRSRIAMSTRDRELAVAAGNFVEFKDRDPPAGPVARGIFMKHAVPGSASQGETRGCAAAVDEILKLCYGLPIALAVAGSGVAFLCSMGSEFHPSCEEYAKELQSGGCDVGANDDPSGVSLNAGILLSLRYLEREQAERVRRGDPKPEYSVTDMYVSLSGLAKQEAVYLSVLSRMWRMDARSASRVVHGFCKMSLARKAPVRLRDGSQGVGLVVHDLHLAFCRRLAEKKRSRMVWSVRLYAVRRWERALRLTLLYIRFGGHFLLPVARRAVR